MPASGPATKPLTPCDVTLGGPPFRITRDGTWWHGADRFNMSNPHHERLVKLFATILSCDEDGQHWLTNPVETCRVTVEDTPFVIIGVATQAGPGQEMEIAFRTNLGEQISLGPDHPLVLPPAAGETPVPRVLVRNRLWARLNRPVYYELANQGSEALAEIDGKKSPAIGIWNGGKFYPLGFL